MGGGCGEEGNQPEGLECVTQSKYVLTVHENAIMKPIHWYAVKKKFFFKQTTSAVCPYLTSHLPRLPVAPSPPPTSKVSHSSKLCPHLEILERKAFRQQILPGSMPLPAALSRHSGEEEPPRREARPGLEMPAWAVARTPVQALYSAHSLTSNSRNPVVNSSGEGLWGESELSSSVWIAAKRGLGL